MKIRSILFLILLSLLVIPVSTAATTCTFTTVGDTMTLDGSCTTDTTISVPDGMTLDGNGFAITAEDPAGDHFRGAVVMNGGTTAHVTNLMVTTAGLASTSCNSGDDRLRGIMFEGASGSITRNIVVNINKGASGCQEGNAIEVRNAPFDGTHPGTQTVDVSYNTIMAYQKTGIVANGDVSVTIEHNDVSESATQANLAANSIQIGFGGIGTVRHNNVDGNQWLGTSDFAASAILIYLADADVSQNNIRGNSDVGLFIVADGGTYNNNRVFDEGTDDVGSTYDIGIGDYGMNNVFTNNKVKGFDTPIDSDDGDVDDTNKVVGNPNMP